MALKWFVQLEDLVEGPLTTEEVELRLRAGRFAPNTLIWGEGMEFWQNLDWWKDELPKMNLNNKHVDSLHDSWHYAVGGNSHGPFSRDRLIEELKTQPDLKDVLLWTRGMKEWAPMFEFHDILSEVGVNKRQFPRAELKGQAVIKGAGITLVAPMVSISEGGLSVRLESELVPGQPVNVEITSAVFSDTIRAKAECRHSHGGILGLKILQMSASDKSTIIQFVKQSQTKFVLKAAA